MYRIRVSSLKLEIKCKLKTIHSITKCSLGHIFSFSKKWQRIYIFIYKCTEVLKKIKILAITSLLFTRLTDFLHLGRVKGIWYLSPMRAAKVQASLRIRAVSPEPSLLAHTSSESRGTFRQKARSLAPLNGWACAVKICHDGMLEDTNSLDGAHFIFISSAYPRFGQKSLP